MLERLIGYRLQPERTLTTIEKLIHFLYIVGQGSSYRTVVILFKRPLSTISDSFYILIAAVLSIYPEVVKELDYEVILQRIVRNPKFFLFFRDCVSTLDSSYIKAFVIGETKLYRNRKGNLS